MSITCEEIEYCRIKANYEADPLVVKSKRDEIVYNLKKNKVALPGFRKGKATELAIRQKLRHQIDSELKSQLTAEAYDEAIFETKMKPIGYPEIRGTHLKGNDFMCELLFLKKPDFELKQYKGFEIPKPQLNYSVSDVAEQIIQNVRVQNADVIPYSPSDFIQEGDELTVDIEATVDEVRLAELSMDGHLVKAGTIMPEFDSQLYGMKAGENKEFDIIFDESDKSPDYLKGKRVKFKVKVHMGTKRFPAALDDGLAQKLGYETLSKFREVAESSAQKQFDFDVKAKVKTQIVNRILANHDFRVPAWLITNEAKFAAQKNNIDWDSLDEDKRQMLLSMSQDKVKLSLIIDSIRDNEPEAIFTDQEIVDKLRMDLEANNRDALGILKAAQDSGQLFAIIASLKDEATMEWLISQSSVLNEEKENNIIENNIIEVTNG
jgi:trigger factor